MPPMQTVFDRKFVLAASLIGVVYALFMAALSYWTRPEVAGAAGVALTSVATAIFKQFENLRFRELADSEGFSVQVVRLRVGPLIAALVTCFLIVAGIPMVICALIMLYKLSFYHVDTIPEYQAAVNRVTYEVGFQLGSTPWMQIGLHVITILAHALFGVVCASVAAKRVAYWYAITAALVLQLLAFVFSGILWMMTKGGAHEIRIDTSDGILSAAYVAAAFAGALLWGRHRERRRQAAAG